MTTTITDWAPTRADLDAATARTAAVIEHGAPADIQRAAELEEAAHTAYLQRPALVPYSGGDSTGTRFIYSGWYERDAGRARPGRTYITEVSVPKLGDGGTQRLHSQMPGEPDREREAGI